MASRHIDDGLKAWPETSHQVALALFFNPERTAKTDEADRILTDYVELHLLSLADAPDFVGLSALAISRIVGAITPEFLLAPIRQLKEDILNTTFVSATGMNKDQLKGYLTRPDRYFDEVMGTPGKGEKINLKRFNSQYLGLRDEGYKTPSEHFSIDAVPVIYNTLVLSKLLLLDRQVVDRIVAEAGGNERLRSQNIMLGWVPTLDGSMQWEEGMATGTDCNVYLRFFKPLPGDSCTRWSDGHTS